jgi:hypothetical protein
MFKPVGRALLKIIAVGGILLVGMPMIMLALAGSFWIMHPLHFLAPFLTIGTIGLVLWAIVEVVRRLSPERYSSDVEPLPPPAGLDEGDVHLVLASKEAIGRLRMLVDRLQGAAPSFQLLGLAAVADGLLNALPHAPDALMAARRPLDFHLPRLVTAAEYLMKLPQGSEREIVADQLAGAAALLNEALRTAQRGRSPDLVSLDQTMRLLPISADPARARVIEAVAN